METVRLAEWLPNSWPGMLVNVDLFETDGAAAASFERAVRASRYEPFTWAIRGGGADRCALSDWVRRREVPDVPQGMFTCHHSLPTSKVVFQKGRIVVEIDETVAEPGASGKDAVIAWLAGVLGAGRPADTPIPVPRAEGQRV